MIRTKPNWNRAINTAYQTLRKHNISDFPIDILSVMESYDDIKIIKYSEMAKKRNCTLQEIIEVNSSEDGVIHYSAKRNKYFIAYNDTLQKQQRVYWTLAHEFGHYLLGHHKESARSNLARNEMCEEEYELYELEADFFARFFLSPPPLIVESNMLDEKKIMDFFGISYSAAISTLNYVKKSFKNGFKFIAPIFITSLFSNFLNKVKFGKTCTLCHSFIYIPEASYCVICGNSDFHNLWIGVDIKMQYERYDLDEMSRARRCPICDNAELYYEGVFCNICGNKIVNMCADTWKMDAHTFVDYIQQSCNELLFGNSRFCHQCGNESSFFQANFFDSWEDERKEKENASLLEEDLLPF